MEWLTLVFPIALAGFIALLFSEYVPLLRGGEGLAVPGKKEKKPSIADHAVMWLITLAYGVTAFANLGANTAPQSFCRFEERGEYAVAELKEPTEIGAVMYYSGLFSGEYRLQFSADGETWTDQTAMSQKHSELFKWQAAGLSGEREKVRYVRIIASDRLWLGEVALFDNHGEIIPADSLLYPDGCAALFDEQDTVPAEPDYLNSSYFDEIYHARTAFEHIWGVYPYEVSHPPLGKLILSLGIRIFGMTPFGWRFMGTLFGVAMVPLMYIFLKKMFGGSAVPACGAAVFAFDFMHFTQTRIATIDTYAVFFIMAMYLFMYLYLTDEEGRGRLYLALSGVSFGLGAASKWTCLYAGAGLGLIWLFDRVRRFSKAKKEGETGNYWRETTGNVLWCLLFFVLIPCVIYYVSYAPYGRASGMSGAGMFFKKDYLAIVLNNQKFMFSYHSGVDATHPYSSRWYQWVLDIRPILYYLRYFNDGTKSSFGAFVSPLLCWSGLVAMLFMAYLAVRRRDGRAAFILAGYLAQLVPWMFVRRIVFEYHYFPCTVFLTLAVCHVLARIGQQNPRRRFIPAAFAAGSILLFAVFYPVLSGARVSAAYCGSFLAWLPGRWPF